MAAILQSLPPISLRFHRPSPFSTTTTSRKSFPVARSRRGLRIYAGKYIREDYLIKKASSKEVRELVKGERKVPLVIDFYATWCGPCILMAQVLETSKNTKIRFSGMLEFPVKAAHNSLNGQLAVEYEKDALFVKVDTDDEYEFSRDMQVRGLPTLLFVSPDANKDAIRTEGLVSIEMIRDIINNEM